MMTPVPSSLFTLNFHVKLFTLRLKLIFSYNSNYRKTNHPHFIYDPRWVCSTVKSQAECVFDVNRILINGLFPKDEFLWDDRGLEALEYTCRGLRFFFLLTLKTYHFHPHKQAPALYSLTSKYLKYNKEIIPVRFIKY